MPFSKFFSVEKCSPKASRKIQFTVLGFFVLSFLLILYSPLVYLFEFLGFKDSNGCTLYTFTGVPCPACGMGRSMEAIFTFDTAHMFYYNPSAPVLYAIALLLFILIFGLSIFNYRIKISPAAYKLWYIPVILLLIVWALNMLWGHHTTP
jgi:hypothetical protein